MGPWEYLLSKTILHLSVEKDGLFGEEGYYDTCHGLSVSGEGTVCLPSMVCGQIQPEHVPRALWCLSRVSYGLIRIKRLKHV